MNYLKYEKEVRKDTDKNQKKKQEYYLKYFKDCKKVLDLACGKGIFLELLKEKGIKGIGVDNDKSICEHVRKKGLKIIQKDIVKYLEETNEKYDGIMLSHIIEHFTIEQANNLMKLCYKVLKPEGTLVIVTPNSESITAHLYFYKDPTHVRFYPHELITFMAKGQGLKLKEQGSNPESKPRIWDEIKLDTLKKEIKRPNPTEVEKILGLERPKIIKINDLIRKVNEIEKFILNPMDTYLVLEKGVQ